MSSSFSSAVNDFSSRFPESFQSVTRSPSRVVLTTLPILFFAILPRAIGNYNHWASLRRKDEPWSLKGWLFALMIKPFGKETQSVEMYERDEDKSTFLPADVPKRKGERATKGWHFAPHRQTDQLPSKKYQDALVSVFAEYAATHSNLVQVKPSGKEGHVNSLFIHESISTPHAVATKEKREIAHIHEGSDGSMHMVPSPADSKTIIEKGWGERHPLAGVIPILSTQYLMIYAPRDDEELEVVKGFLKGAVAYMTGKREALQ